MRARRRRHVDSLIQCSNVVGAKGRRKIHHNAVGLSKMVGTCCGREATVQFGHGANYIAAGKEGWVGEK